MIQGTEQQSFYMNCLPKTLQNHNNQNIAFIGRIIRIYQQQQKFVLLLDAQQNIQVLVQVASFRSNYQLLDINIKELIAEQKYLTAEDKILIDKLMMKKSKQNVSNTQNDQNQPKAVNISQEFIFVPKQLLLAKQSKKINNSYINQSQIQQALQQGQQISIHSFKVGQYIQVRGQFIDENTIKMQSFSEIGQNYGLHNEILKNTTYYKDIFY